MNNYEIESKIQHEKVADVRVNHNGELLIAPSQSKEELEITVIEYNHIVNSDDYTIINGVYDDAVYIKRDVLLCSNCEQEPFYNSKTDSYYCPRCES
mgnify:CR=1 FL=1